MVHRPNPGLYRDRPPVVVELDARYQREVEASMRKAQKAYDRAQRAAAKFKARIDSDSASAEDHRVYQLTVAAVEARLAELREVERLMQPTAPTGTNWSGKGSVRFVPKGQR